MSLQIIHDSHNELQKFQICILRHNINTDSAKCVTFYVKWGHKISNFTYTKSYCCLIMLET